MNPDWMMIQTKSLYCLLVSICERADRVLAKCVSWRDYLVTLAGQDSTSREYITPRPLFGDSDFQGFQRGKRGAWTCTAEVDGTNTSLARAQ
jgi:hypothetical protein